MDRQQVRRQIGDRIVDRVFLGLECDIFNLAQNQSTQAAPAGVGFRVWQIRECWIRENVLESVRGQAGEDHDG